jgi:hypothetical protein
MERYSVCVDNTIVTKQQLFARFTDTIYLGESGIENWDWFYDLMWHRFESDLVVEISNRDLSGLSDRDRRIYFEQLRDLQGEFPAKLIIKGQSTRAKLWARTRWLIGGWRWEISRRFYVLRRRLRSHD